jgi:hypothetical protein
MSLAVGRSCLGDGHAGARLLFDTDVDVDMAGDGDANLDECSESGVKLVMMGTGKG